MGKRKRLLVIAGAVIALIVVGLVGAYAGGRATEDREAALAPNGTPVNSLEDCPWGEASCVLALAIERALQFGRVDAVVEFGKPAFFECPGSRVANAPSPLCDDVTDLSRVEGYPVARRFSQGSVVAEDGLRDFLQDFVDRVNAGAEDDVGEGALKLYGFGCPERATPLINVSCARLAIIFSAIVGEGDEAERELLVFWAVGLFRGETLPVTEVWDGPVLDSERATILQTGGYVSDLGEVYVIDQSLRGADN